MKSINILIHGVLGRWFAEPVFSGNFMQEFTSVHVPVYVTLLYFSTYFDSSYIVWKRNVSPFNVSEYNSYTSILINNENMSSGK